MKPDIDEQPANHFIIEALASIPRWVVGLIGTMIGTGITLAFFLQVTGLAGPAHRVIDAWAAKFETAAKNVDRSVSKLDTIVTRIENLEEATRRHAADSAHLDRRVSKLEQEAAEQRDEIQKIKASQPSPPKPRTPRPVPVSPTTTSSPAKIYPLW